MASPKKIIARKFKQRILSNEKKLNRIADSLNITGKERETLQAIVKGRKPLHFKETSKRLNLALRQIRGGQFSILRRVIRLVEFQQVQIAELKRQVLSLQEQLEILGGDVFYVTHKELIKDFNQQQKEGKVKVSTEKKLRNEYAEFKNRMLESEL